MRVSVLQPKQIKEIKDFLLTARRKDASSVKIKKAPGVTKFKVGVRACVSPWCRTLREDGVRERGTCVLGRRWVCGGRGEKVSTGRHWNWWFLRVLHPAAMTNLLLSASALVLCCMRLCWQCVSCVVGPVGIGFFPEVAAVRCR